MALNGYYRSEPDPLWSRFREESKNSQFYDDIRDYLLEEHSSNFTQFIELCSFPCDSIEYWEELAESDQDPRRIIDSVFQDIQANRQQRYIENIIVGCSRYP